MKSQKSSQQKKLYGKANTSNRRIEKTSNYRGKKNYKCKICGLYGHIFQRKEVCELLSRIKYKCSALILDRENRIN